MSEESTFTLLGWHAQTVVNAADGRYYIGSYRLGPDIAEKEALFWACIWRLSVDDNVPTLFCSDSETSKRQAEGTMHGHSAQETTHALRQVYQALEAAIGPTHCGVRHVVAHAGDPMNEFVDVLAKFEAKHGHNLTRFNLDMRSLRPGLPFLWMKYGDPCDLPVVSGDDLLITPPQMPRQPSSLPMAQMKTTWVQSTMMVCLATANVGSLYTGPDGHAGKLSYLREQMHGIGINILGVQEARSPPGMSVAGDVLRLSSGCDRGNLGVELWLNMTQPIGYAQNLPLTIRKNQVTVAWSTPRTLLVHLQHPHLDVWILVGHAPQSGRAEEERNQWWEMLADKVLEHVGGSPLWTLIDANARSGPSDNHHVMERDDSSSVNTPLMRAFLEKTDLYLAATDVVHHGQDSTWTHPGTLHQSRIDYVMVPSWFRSRCTFSRVVEEFDLGGSAPDHEVVALQLQWDDQHYVMEPVHTLTSGNRHALRRDQFCLPPLQTLQSSWDADVESQLATLEHGLVRHMRCTTTPARSEPKKSYISTTTWQLRQTKLQLRKRHQQIGTALRKELLWKAWRSLCGWRDLGHRLRVRRPSTSMLKTCWRVWHAFATWRGCSDIPTTEVYQYQQMLLCARLRAAAELSSQTKQLRHSLVHERDTALQAHLETVGPEVPASCLLPQLKPFIGPTNLKKAKKPALPQITRPDGQPCQSVEDLANTWAKFFGDMEGGFSTDSHGLLQAWQEHQRQWHVEEAQATCTELPSLTHLEDAFRRVKPGKAVGLDLLPPELCHHHAPELARLCYPLMMKIMYFGQEPLGWKGGRLIPAWKGKGPTTLPESYRSLLISSHLGKAVHRAIRQSQCALMEQFWHTAQLGGRRHVPVTLGVHHVRTFLRVQKQQQRAAGLFFVDFREAFYRVVRPLAVHQHWSDEQVAQILRHFQLPATAMDDLRRHLADPCAVQQANLSVWHRQAVSAIHSTTWFQVPGQADYIQTTRGSRPGDCFADVIFSFVLTRLLGALQALFAEHDLLEYIPDVPDGPFWQGAQGQVPCIGPVWMDDICLVFSGSDADSLLQKVQTGVSLFLDCCRGFAFTPNMDKGKTEVLFALRGRGARRVQRILFTTEPSHRLHVVCENGVEAVHVVGAYQHLGGQAHHAGKSTQEARKRLSIAHCAFSQHRKLLYHNANLSFEKRKQLMLMLVLSKLTYAMDSWVLETNADKKMVHSGVLRLYKRFLRIPHDQEISDEEVLHRAGLPSPTDLLRRSRLRYLAQLYACSDSVPWGLLQQDVAWTALLRSDLHWMWQQLKNASFLEDPLDHYSQWEEVIRHSPGYWRRLVNRACEHAVRQRQLHYRVHSFHKTLAEIHCEVGTLAPPVFEYQVPQPEEIHACLPCQKWFSTRAALGAHLFRHHGQCSRLRSLYDQTACGACLKEFHTAKRLQSHLRTNEMCRRHLLGSRIRCDPMPGIGSTEDARKEACRDGLIPTLQAEGPLPQQHLGADHDGEHVELRTALAELLLEPFVSVDVLTQTLMQTVMQHVVTWTDLCATVNHMRRQFTETDYELMAFPQADLHQALDMLCSPRMWPFLQKPYVKDLSHDAKSFEHWTAQAAANPDDACYESVRPHLLLGKRRVILHAAGRRRLGDFQHYVDLFVQENPGVTFHTISIDIIISAAHGDLADQSTQQFWLTAIKQRRIHGFIAGPPCNTWSTAREAALQEDGEHAAHGPRVVRTLEELWGMDSLSLKELDAVLLGNALLQFSILALTLLVYTGGAGVLEHPALLQPHSASIWHLAAILLLQRFPGVRLLQIQQGKYGAPSPKPTSLLTVHLPAAERALQEWQLTQYAPKSTSVGRSADGSFKTTPLKEYPPSLCAGLAQAFAHALTKPSRAEAPDPDPDFVRLCATLHISHRGSFVGTDTAGHL
eukprot:Skav235745  [mRNA]  locus=scaffold1612:161426:167122:- [translate_table: standard]